LAAAQVDDHRVIRPAQQRQGGLDYANDADDIGIKLLKRGIPSQPGCARPSAIDPGVVDQDVQPVLDATEAIERRSYGDIISHVEMQK
jgi:hypothetical protein